MASSLPQNYPQTEIEFEGSLSSPSYYRRTFNMDTSLASASASTSTAANPNKHYPYDVFLNHRGPDTKKNFASHLYRRLLLYGFQVFLDQKELQQGDNLDSQIKAAIESASVHVAIFSPRYAESYWCLEELLLMLKTGATIIPVFYNVKPSELRWTRGSYAEALHKHELRYDSATVEKWRNALSLVADKSGFELEACNSDEGELLENVVELVLKKVRKTGLNVAKYPTGLDDKVKDFASTVLLQQQKHSRKPQIIGIVGLGGVGKTTLAKELFNRQNSLYRSSCFLFDVRDNATKGLLNSLQSKLLKSVTGLDKAIDSIDEGIEILKKHLSRSQVLLVLDDVDNVNQLNAFLPIQTVLGSDSLILITSRDKAVLKSSGVEEKSIFKLNGLEPQHSRQLFCSHACSQPRPILGFESLVDKFIEACDGLPLSLKVIGALLYGKDDQSEWQNQLCSLQQTLPSEIQQRLKISYDSLNEEEHQIFLDIACFFIGENRDKALRIWMGTGWKGCSQEFQNLHNKCLVELDSENNIQMHDHLRDMGRDIAKDSNLQLPRRVRCSAHNIDDLLQQSYVLIAVRGITMAPTARRPVYRHGDAYNDFEQDCLVSKMSKIDSEEDCFVSNMPWFKRSSHEMFENRVMKRLNRLPNTPRCFLGVGLLDVEDGHMERILRRVQSPNTIWLRWYKCPYSSLPSWIPTKNLTVLEVGGSVLRTLWPDDSQAPLQLRELQIFAPLFIIPKSIGYLKHLERIVVSFSTGVNLEKLPEEFCHLQSLKALVLRNCSKLKSLPNSLGDLLNLEHLDMFGSRSLEKLPKSFGNLIRLEYLDLSRCRDLTISRETLGNIRMLEHLDLSCCTKIKVLPPQVAYQRSLAELYLVNTNLKEFPIEMGDLSDLEVLKIGSSELHSLPPSLGELKNLKKLHLSSCSKLKYLPESVGLLPQLTELFVRQCALREMTFKEVEGQKEKSADSSSKEFMPRLQHFKIWETEISEISFGEGVCPSLHELEIMSCNTLKKIEGLCGLAKLQKLSITCCRELEELPSLEHCRSLKKLEISGCWKVQLKVEVARQLSQQGCFTCVWPPNGFI